jgi:amidophosphoribosyltransferase
LVCCDDSIVRGTQMKKNAGVFFRNGAKEIHVRISCPPLVYKCPYLNFTTTRTDMELITRRYIHGRTQGVSGQQAPDLCRFIDHTTPEYSEMVENIRKEMNFTSLKFNDIEGLISSIGLPKENLCTYCFDGSGCRD